MLKVIFFDIDNTLLSFSGYVKESMREGFRKFGLPEYEEWMFPIFERINNRLWQKIERGELSFDRLLQIRWNLIFNELGILFDGSVFEAFFRDCLFDSAIPEEGAMELLKFLQGRYLICAASNGPYLQQVNRLKKCGMLPYFSSLFISEELGSSKPSESFFAACFERLNGLGIDTVKPEEAMIIGDSLTSDILGGMQYGMKTCFYNPGSSPVPEKIRPDYTVATLLEIKKIL